MEGVSVKESRFYDPNELEKLVSIFTTVEGKTGHSEILKVVGS